MASKPKMTAASASRKQPSPGQDVKATTPSEEARSTREAVREIVRRYRETFERLGR
jgi:hypothetical protein